MQQGLQSASSAKGNKVHRSVMNAAAAVAVAGVLVKLVAVFKEIAVAGVYGRSDAMDAFLAAALIPALLVNLISESMNQALVPTLIKVREREGHEQAQRLLSGAMLWMCVLLVGASLGMGLGARGFFPLIASHFAAPKLDLAVHLFYALLPVVVLTGIATNCTAVLNTLDRFALPALAPMVNSLAVIAGTLVVGERWGIWAMVYASVAGALLHAVLVAWMMHTHGFRFELRWPERSAAAREVAGQYGPVLLSSVVASGGLLVDQAMAAMLAAGSVSTLAYANRFVSVGMTLLAGAVSTAVVPHLSRLVAHEDWSGCRQTLRRGLKATALVSVPFALALILGARFLIRITLQHGAFGVGDTAAVTPVLAMYAIQIPFFVCSRVFYRFLVAKRRTDLILNCGVVNLGLDVALNLILMRWMGVAGIALATSLWTVSTFFFLGYWSWRLLPPGSKEAQ
jgi:putative peptidoglycan lipid II flippase